MSRKLDRWQAKAKESMECGYFRIHRSNRVDLLGESTDNQQVDNLLLGFLNLDGQENSQPISSSMAYFEAPENRIAPLLSGLANIALTNRLGISDVRYVDMEKGAKSKQSLRCLNRRLKGLHNTEPSSLHSLILVNAGTSPEGKQIERASSLVDSLAGLPPEVFRVGMVASSAFMKSIQEPDLKEENQPEEADVASQPVALVGQH